MTKNKANGRVPAPQDDYIRIIPMGGLAEVGMNCCIVEHNGSMIMLDCGLTFPNHDGFGVDIILPDLTYVINNLDRLEAVVLSHGHEDHIGALPYFLREVDVPVYGGRMTVGMLERKLGEHNLSGEVELHRHEPGDRVEIGPFTVEFVHINHSVPNAMSLSVETSLGRIFFTGDWKIDHTPLGEPPMDLVRIAEMGREGTLIVLGDSTNAGSPGYSRSEADVKEGLAGVLDTAEGRVIVTQFSSNIYRVQAMLELAVQFDRKVALLGRSMLNNFSLARDLGFISVPRGLTLIELDDVDKYPDDELLLISTGSQAEHRSQLTRMAYGSHHKLKIRDTDTVIFSARQIPGNERGIQEMINQLTRQGATVITQRQNPNIHATGHARREEMKLLLNLLRPKHLIPVHGSFRMRKHHADLGRSLGLENRHLINDGDVFELTSRTFGKVDRVHVGRVFVDNSSGDVENAQLRDRKKLAHSGIIVAFLVLDRSTGEISSGPDLIQRGFLSDDDKHLLGKAADYARNIISDLSVDERKNFSETSETLRTAVRRFFRKRLDRKPVVIPIVHEM